LANDARSYLIVPEPLQSKCVNSVFRHIDSMWMNALKQRTSTNVNERERTSTAVVR
jgi:hypothetical protein